MKRFLILAGLLPSLACAQTQATKPQFVPPNGLPLNTPLGAARNADGSGVTTFATMQAGIDAAVTPAELTEALTPYLTQSAAEAQYFPLTGGPVNGDVTFNGKLYARAYAPAAPDDKSAYLCADTGNGYLYPATAPCIPSYLDPRYSTPDQVSSAVAAEKTRAMSVEEGLQTDLTNVSENYVSNSDFSTNIAPYLKSADAAATYLTQSNAASTYYTQSQADSRYATPSSVSSAVQTETTRAQAAETANANTISSLQSAALLKTDAAKTYLPLTGGTLSGKLNTGETNITSGGLLLTGGGSILMYDNGALGAYFSTNTFGDLVINTAVSGGGGVRLIPASYDKYPAGAPAGSMHFCSSCYVGSGAKGIVIVSNGTSWVSTDGQAISY